MPSYRTTYRYLQYLIAKRYIDFSSSVVYSNEREIRRGIESLVLNAIKNQLYVREHINAAAVLKVLLNREKMWRTKVKQGESDYERLTP
jgi:hypothetical protein